MARKDIVKRSRYHFGYGKRKHAKKGLYAMEIYAMALFGTVCLFAYAFSHPGNAAPAAGAVGLMLVGLAGFGIWMAMQSFHEMDRRYGVSKLAIALNGSLVLFYAFLFINGM